jgi:hypothetical protein
MEGVPSVDFEQPGLAVGVEEKVVAVEFEAVVGLRDQFLHCPHGLDDAPLNVRKGIVGLVDPNSGWREGYLESMKFLSLSRNHLPPMRLT